MPEYESGSRGWSPGWRLACRSFGRRSILIACTVFAAQVAAQGPDDTASQRALFDSFQMCATLHLPEDFRRIRAPADSARSAADACRRECLALAGQFALDNPGSRQVDVFFRLQHKRVVDSLSDWIAASSKAVTPHPLSASGRPPAPPAP